MTGPTSQLGSKPLKMGSDVDPACQIPPVQSAVTKFLLYMSLISGLLAAITSPKLGALSDRYGRLRIICASSAGMVVSEVLTIVIAKNPDMISVKWLLAGAIFDGLGGSFIAAMAVANAYATDCTHPSKRSVSFGYFYSCLYFGIALGPLFGGYIIKATGDILIIFYIALAGHGLFLLWLLFIVPESLSKRRQMMARKKLQDDYDGLSFSTNFASMEPGIGLAYHSIKSAVTRTNPFAPLAVLWPTGEGTTPALRRNLAFLAAVDTTMFGVTMGAVTCALLYSEYMFGWGNFETSIYVFVVNTCRVTVLIIVLPLITRILRGPAAKAVQRSSGCDGVDLGILRVAIIFDTLGYVGYAAVGTGPLFILSGAIAAIGNMGSPTLSASLTKHVPSDQTGRILGAMGLLHAIARIVAPLIFNLIYARTVGTVPQTVFVCLAATFALSFIFSLFIRPHSKPAPPNGYVLNCFRVDIDANFLHLVSWDQTYQTSGTAVDNDSAGDSEPLIHAAPEPVDPEENGR